MPSGGLLIECQSSRVESSHGGLLFACYFRDRQVENGIKTQRPVLPVSCPFIHSTTHLEVSAKKCLLVGGLEEIITNN